MIDCYFIRGPISKSSIGIRQNDTGAIAIFEGHVRADVVQNQRVEAIDFTLEPLMAKPIAIDLLNKLVANYNLHLAIIWHSQGLVQANDCCFRVEIHGAHRKEVFGALPEIVDAFKREVPVFGKEIFNDHTYGWKRNRD